MQPPAQLTHIILIYSIMPTKKELYQIAKAKKKGKCPKISKYNKVQLAAFISSGSDSEQTKKFTAPYLRKKNW